MGNMRAGTEIVNPCNRISPCICDTRVVVDMSSNPQFAIDKCNITSAIKTQSHFWG